MRRYLTLRQVADALGKTPQWMYRHVARLIKDHRFPPRDAAMGGWDSAAITRWQETRLPAELRLARTVAAAAPLEIMIALPPGADDLALAGELDRRADHLFNAA